MAFDKEFYDEKFKELLKLKSKEKYFIRENNNSFKINLYKKKAEKSFLIADFLDKARKNAELRKDLILPEPLILNYWVITINYYSMLYIAKALVLTKGFETDDHFSTQIALGKLFVITDELEKEDLEILDQSHKILEEEYITYFEETRKESRNSRYDAIKTYEDIRVRKMHENAKKFIAKLSLMID